MKISLFSLFGAAVTEKFVAEAALHQEAQLL